jgi:hypothetical protein
VESTQSDQSNNTSKLHPQSEVQHSKRSRLHVPTSHLAPSSQLLRNHPHHCTFMLYIYLTEFTIFIIQKGAMGYRHCSILDQHRRLVQKRGVSVLGRGHRPSQNGLSSRRESFFFAGARVRICRWWVHLFCADMFFCAAIFFLREVITATQTYIKPR